MDAKAHGDSPPNGTGAPINALFHDVYDRVRGGVSLTIPVLVVLADALTLVRGVERSERTFTPRSFHTIKAVAHAPIAVFAAVHGAVHTRIEVPLKATLAGLDEHLRSIDKSRDRDLESACPESWPESIEPILSLTRNYLREVLAVGAVDLHTLEAFAHRIGPSLLRATADATRIQLAALDEHVGEILGELDETEKQNFEVVVAGAHQARVRSLAMQYFQKVLAEPPGAEFRLTYAEGVRDVDEALALVGTRLLDRAIAKAFFGDPQLLQRDILGDAAKKQIDAFDFRRHSIDRARNSLG